MNTLSYRTANANSATVERRWLVVDAAGQTVGRLASRIARVLRGKDKPSYTPHVDCGDNVVVVNAAQVVFNGNKETDKTYFRHSGYPGGIRSRTPKEVRDAKPTFIVENAVKGMLPRTKLGRAMAKKLHVYAGPDHPHQAQQPQSLDIA